MTHTLRQKIVTAISLALALALACVAVVAGIAVYAMASGESGYGDGSYSNSARSYGISTRVIPDYLDNWEAYFGQGTAQIRAEAVDDGVETLTVALELVPKDADSEDPEPTDVEDPEDYTAECRARMNLAVGQEIQGDRLFEAGYFDRAQVAYEDASATVAQCVPQGESPDQQKQDTDEKAQDAREKAEGSDGNEPPEPPPGGNEPEPPEGGEPPPTTQQLKEEELLRRAQEAERLKRENEQRNGGFGSWDGENW